jgi:acetoin utilization deacetylase AcuC-like enzyme
VELFYSEAYNATAIGFDTTRKADAIVASLQRDPIVGVELVAPTPATADELVLVHDRSYVDAVFAGEPWGLASSHGIPGGWDDEFPHAVAASSGGVRDAALAALLSGGVTGSLSSGLHHARRDSGNGYCTFNGLVLAALAARDAGAQRVLILDLDAHCGGGTAALIAGLDGVEQVDVSVIHYDTFSPRHDARLAFARAEVYLPTVRAELDDIIDPERVDLVLYNAGMDPHEDAGGVWGIDAAMLAQRETMVFDWLQDHRLPCAFVLAGGYTTGCEMADLVALHRLTIAAAATG